MVIVTKDVKIKLKNLVYELYEKGHFKFINSSEKYVNRIFDAIEKTDKHKSPKPNKPKSQKAYGKFSIPYTTQSKSTTYYITFDKIDNDFLIVDFFNKNSSDYAQIKGLRK